ncbi:MAG: bifunctional 4-hydroxy-2-oxoglutarate aldolase/2-dehydro-3-deoxy-phosphogluconate aldolase [Candidatus Omnitrophota bacterium]
MDIKRFKNLPVMGILRGIEMDAIEPIVNTAASAGLETIEITMNTEGAPELIRQAIKVSKKRLMIGAGTVLDLATLKTALDAGATFIVSPVLVPEVVKYCVKKKIPVFPGALTPQEVYNAWNAGATMVKVFPTGALGPDYIKELKGPFDDIELLACGGVTPENVKEYFAAGASAVAFGGSVFRKYWLLEKDYDDIYTSIKNYLAKVR